MQELSEDIRRVTEKEIVLAEDIEKHLRETAKKWADYCLTTLDGNLLTKGLMVSKAIVDFLNEMEQEDFNLQPKKET